MNTSHVIVNGKFIKPAWNTKRNENILKGIVFNVNVHAEHSPFATICSRIQNNRERDERD